jgi:hypothetical protein
VLCTFLETRSNGVGRPMIVSHIPLTFPTNGRVVVPYPMLMTEDAPQRDHPLRELFNGLRYVVRYGVAFCNGR